MLSIREISRSFMQRGLVLDRLSLEASEGDSIAIMGPSGSGKTTLLNMIGLLDRPDSGDIKFRGASLAEFDEDEAAGYRNKDIGFVFQDHLLLPHLTIKENIYLPLIADGRNNIRDKEEHIRLLMDKTGIANLSDKYPFRISGGEAQRAALVRALANKPSMLLADEPTGSLDAKNATIMADLLVEMNRDLGITIIMATHSGELAGKMSRLLKLHEGKLID